MPPAPKGGVAGVVATACTNASTVNALSGNAASTAAGAKRCVRSEYVYPGLRAPRTGEGDELVELLGGHVQAGQE